MVAVRRRYSIIRCAPWVAVTRPHRQLSYIVSSSSPAAARARQRAAPLLVALFVAAFGFLPIANWVPGGHSAPWYRVVTGFWMSGLGVVVGAGLVLAILSRGLPALWRDGALDGALRAWRAHPRRTALVIAACAFAAYSFVALHIFGGRPLFIDELTQTLQAQILAGGAISRASGPHPEFFGSLLMARAHGHVFSQFPVGGPVMLVPGILVGVPWISNPLWGAIAVLAFASFVRVAEPRPAVALGATVVFAFAPFALFMSGSRMGHVSTLMWIAIALATMIRVMRSDAPRPLLALVNGLALGCAATIRPVDALAYALPAGAWYLLRAMRSPARWRDVLAAGAGVALPLAGLFWVNAHTTGRPFLFGYELLWGKSHALGFHSAPWGLVHTPARGVELISIYFLQLQTYLFESPLPSLLPAICAFALTRAFEPIERYLVTSGALLVGLYFLYWHEGFYLGPRFMYLLFPVLALYTARGLPLIRERFGAGLPYRASVYGAVCAAIIAAATLVPTRARAYRHSLLTMRWDADSAASAAGVSHALVLVRTSWGSQLVARLWSLGVPRSETELIYHSVDACVLEHRLDSLRAAGVAGAEPESFHDLFADSSRLVNSHLSPDSTERLLPGAVYSPTCVNRISADRDGFTLFTPLLLAHGGGNVYAQDLGARDSLLLAQYPDRAVYLLRPPSARLGDTPRFYPLSRDSLRAAWGASGPTH